MKDYLLVIDMQKDFVDGSLGTPEAQLIVPAVVAKIKEFDGEVIITRDTHGADYLQTQEGKYLPVEHCIEGTPGWELIPEIEAIRVEKDLRTYDKGVFGSVDLAADLLALYEQGEVASVTIIGLCTDICVASNALILKSTMPELPIYIDPACCAGVTPEKHAAALETMASCQIIIE